MSSIYGICVGAVSAVLIFGVGFFVGKEVATPAAVQIESGSEVSATETEDKHSVKQDLVANSDESQGRQDSGDSAGRDNRGSVVNDEQAPAAEQQNSQDAGLTSEQLGQRYGVPSMVESGAAEFALVSVIEGVEANRMLSQNLQLITNQRQGLANLVNQFAQTAPGMSQQRELLATQLNQLRNSLNQNLVAMRQAYGYSLQNNYLFVPHQARLLELVGEGEDVQTKLVHEFGSAQDYESFQEMNARYTNLRIEEQDRQAEAEVDAESEAEGEIGDAQGGEFSAEGGDGLGGQGDGGQDGQDGQAVAAGAVEGELERGGEGETGFSEQRKLLRAELMERFSYDPESRYVIEFVKGALYARPASN